jgi:hypothetical protein
MDQGQIFGCFIMGGIFMIATELLDNLETTIKPSNRTLFIYRYLVFVIGVGVIFSMGLSIGRQ